MRYSGVGVTRSVVREPENTDVALQSVRIPDELAARLTAVAEATKRTKTSFIVEALERYLEEREDLEIALARLRDPASEWVEHEAVRDELGSN